MTDKTWTATDLTKGKITIDRKGSIIHFGFRYRFKDGNGDVIAELPTRSLIKEVQISSLPAPIASALLAVQTHLYEEALQREGMD